MSSNGETLLTAELLEFDLDAILDYASLDNAYKLKRKPQDAADPPPDYPITVIQRSIIMKMKSPVALQPQVLNQYVDHGLTAVSRDAYSFATDSFEVKAGTLDLPLLNFFSRLRGGAKRQLLLSINVLNDDVRQVVFEELKFAANKVKKCRHHFAVTDMRWELELNKRSRTVTVHLHYKVELRQQLYRYFSSDVTVPLMRILGPHLDEYPAVKDDFAMDYKNMPIDTHLFYKIITDRTAQMPKAECSFHHPYLLTELLPFQQRSVGWLLDREGARYVEDLRSCTPIPLISDDMGKALAAFPHTDTDWLDGEMSKVVNKICFGWKRKFYRGDVCWLNVYTGNILTESHLVKTLLQYYNDAQVERLPGRGLLSEEMGLGKTVEIMSLILLHPRPAAEVGQDISLQFKEEGDFRLVRKVKTTLIAAPDSILNQWYREILRLCPSLLVTIYRGLGKYPELANVPRYIAEYLQRFDIVLMNYATMSKETDYANYSSRHVPTRGGTKRPNSSQSEKSAQTEERVTADTFKAEFKTDLFGQVETGFSQKKYDRAVLEELAARLRQEDPSTIPHTHFYESPLMLCQWWRVVLDEVQMVSSGATRAFDTASIIPRFHSWGVSGTPVRLPAVLQFLKVAPFSYDISKFCWKLLTAPEGENTDFVNIWLNLSLRHTKAMVHEDIKLPPQQRILLTIPFTKVEQDKYNEIFESTLASIGIYSDNIPSQKESNFSSTSYVHLRSWLVKLRQLCGNLQVGRLPRAHASRGRNKNKFLLNGIPELKTLENVLDDMIDAVVDEMSESEKGIINRLLEICLLLEYTLYPGEVIEVLNIVLVEINKLIARLTSKKHKDLQEYQRVKDILESQGALSGKDLDDGDASDQEDEEDEEQTIHKIEDEIVVKKEENTVDETQILEHLTRFEKLKELVSSNRMRLRSWNLTQHKCYFLLASAHFQLYDPEYQEKIKNLRVSFDSLRDIHSKVQLSGLLTAEEVSLFTGFDLKTSANKNYLADFQPDESLSEEEQKVERNKYLESTFYDLAEECRKEILKHPIKEVANIIAKRITERSTIEAGEWVNDGSKSFPKTSKKLFMAIPDIDLEAITDIVADVKSMQLVEQFVKLVKQLNTQAELINENTQLLKTVLTNPLLTTEKTPDGEEYEQSIQDQDRASCLLLVISQMLMDRSHATLESKTKVTQINKQQEQDFKLEAQRVSDRKFLKESQAKRLKVKPSAHISMEELIQDARLLEVELRDNYKLNGNPELFKEIAHIMRVIFENEKNCQLMLQKELNSSFNAIFNFRVEYFKQLQQISDTVQNKSFDFPQENFEPSVIDAEFHQLFYQLAAARNKLSRSTSRWRYLATLIPKEKKLEEIQSEAALEEVMCIICQSPIVVGSLTACGHRFCKACLDEWLARSASCPICKSYTDKDTVYYFTHYKADLKAQAVENGHNDKDSQSGSQSKAMHQVYKQLDIDTLRKIQRINLSNSYGSKVDLIVKQIKHLQNEDPEVQIVIFSQWQDLLVILAFAFDKAGISYVSAKGSHVAAYKNRKSDPVEEFKDKRKLKTCFLLNAQAQSSGLTLINATHIFLCDPLVNTPAELQAISRIHRIGQKEVTTVWMFAIENSVEENIVALGTRKRLEYLRANARETHTTLKSDGDIQDSDLRTAESFALSMGTTSEGTFSGNSESVADADLYNVYFGEGPESTPANPKAEQT